MDINDLAPCKPAAARFCDRFAGTTMGNLMKCGAKLAAKSNEVSNSCRQVLRRYGQL